MSFLDDEERVQTPSDASMVRSGQYVSKAAITVVFLTSKARFGYNRLERLSEGCLFSKLLSCVLYCIHGRTITAVA